MPGSKRVRARINIRKYTMKTNGFNENTARFNKYHRNTKLYFDYIADKCIYPPELDSINLKISGKNPLILGITYFPSKSRCYDGVWYSMMAMTQLSIRLFNPTIQGSINNEYKRVQLIIKKPFFSSQRKVTVVEEDFKHIIRCSRVELNKSQEYIKKNDEWVLEK